LEPNTRVSDAYGTKSISERHRHRYEFNNDFRERLTDAGLVPVAVNPELDLVEAVEIPAHRWFVGVQFHPEYKSRPLVPHPLFAKFIEASAAYKQVRISGDGVDEAASA